MNGIIAFFALVGVVVICLPIAFITARLLIWLFSSAIDFTINQFWQPDKKADTSKYHINLPNPIHCLRKININKNNASLIPTIKCFQQSRKSPDRENVPEVVIDEVSKVHERILGGHAHNLPQEKEGNQPNANRTFETSSQLDTSQILLVKSWRWNRETLIVSAKIRIDSQLGNSVNYLDRGESFYDTD